MALPDLEASAFSFVALCVVSWATAEDGSSRSVRSDQRSQLRYLERTQDEHDVDARVYLVGLESGTSGADLPALIAFVDPERARERCREGARFQLLRGQRVDATGVVRMVTR